MLERPIVGTPVAVVDVEATGPRCPGDRIVELSIRRLEFDGAPPRCLDTLVNPLRPVSATHIHGISDEDVRHAPTFGELAGQVLELLDGAVLLAYNAEFDARFLRAELALAGVPVRLPYLCLMRLRPTLGLGPRCALAQACRELGVSYGAAHVAGADVEAAAHLFALYCEHLIRRGVATYSALVTLAGQGVCGDLEETGELRGLRPVWSAGESVDRHPPAPTLVPRPTDLPAAPADRAALRTYGDALDAVLCDLSVTTDEVASTLALQRELGLRVEQIRALHARALLAVIVTATGDDWLDEVEAQRIQAASRCLAELGWSPLA